MSAGIEVIVHDCDEWRALRMTALEEYAKCLRFLGARVRVKASAARARVILQDLMSVGVRAEAFSENEAPEAMSREQVDNGELKRANSELFKRVSELEKFAFFQAQASERARGTAFCPEGVEDLRRRVEALEEFS